MPVSSGKAVRVKGIVQGVGFRPFVRNLAVSLGLLGDVYNDSAGVHIRILGPSTVIAQFLSVLHSEPPPLSVVESIESEDLYAEVPKDFRIIQSQRVEERTVGITPDAATCADCRQELLDPHDRRYRYPFINCTHCGPRYTIIEDLPYDRPKTVMRDFMMCTDCRSEYDNPIDRRYHAQPTCCRACGPSLQLLDEEGSPVRGDPVSETVFRIREGGIVAIKGLGGFHLACDATNEEAVKRLRARKQREEKPLAVMVRELSVAAALVDLPAYAERLLRGPLAPILIARQQMEHHLAPSIAPINDFFGVMLPYTPLHILLFEEGLDALVMTSANQTDEPIAIDNDEALERLRGIADAYLMHDRRIHVRVDDSVMLASLPKPTLIRRARGLSPSGIETGREVDGILAFGAFMKNTFALGRGSMIFPSQHIGDLNNQWAMDMHTQTLRHMKDILAIDPSLAVCDMHPDYPTTQMAEACGLPLIKVQHHHAHLVSLMAEARFYQQSIGIALDGTGYGEDGAIWGGEIFLFDPVSYTRCYHLEYVPLPGGDKAVEEPWRMALAYLLQNGIDYQELVRDVRADSVAKLLLSDIPMFRTSSMGRLFDAVSSLCGLCDISTYDAKAPMLLEGALEHTPEAYPFSITDGIITTGGLIHGVVEDLGKQVRCPMISGKFHWTVVEMLRECARSIRAEEDVEHVFLSGGVFMNAYLVREASKALADEGFEVHLHGLLPPNDGCVSVGQVLVAAERRRAGY